MKKHSSRKLHHKKIRRIGMILLAVCMMFLAGCNSAQSDESTLERAKKQGYVTIGFANEKPYAYQTADGELTGEAVEVARVILQNLGIEEMRGTLTEFASLIPGLQANRFDTITAGMFITPDRAKDVAFANPEYSIGEAMATERGNPLNLHSYKDIADHDSAKIAVPGGAIEYNYLVESGVPEERILTVSDMPSALAALQSDRADVITATGPSLQAILDSANDPNIERVMDFEQPNIGGKSVRGYGATAFRKEDNDFVEAFNKELSKLQQSGELLKIIEPFGFTEEELPGDITLEELLENDQ